MGDGATVSTTPMEWRSRVRAVAQARPVAFREDEIGRGLLLLREMLKTPTKGEGKSAGRTKRSFSRLLIVQRSK